MSSNLVLKDDIYTDIEVNSFEEAVNLISKNLISQNNVI